MARKYTLVDFENCQPDQFSEGELRLFLGAQQRRIPVEVAERMQERGERARYIRIGESGPNALDFCLAFYLGRMVEGDPAGKYVIVSNDRGFDPLLRHLKGQGISVSRSGFAAAGKGRRGRRKARAQGAG